MMTAQQLKNSILQRAIEGKLVEQRAEEGTAKKLLKDIKLEKEKLVKEGKIKKSKPLPPITEDEIPFDIPDSWEWVRLGDISNYAQPKTKIKPCDINENLWSLDLEDIEKDTGRVINKIYTADRSIKGEKVVFSKGNILYSKLRPYLKKILIATDDGITSPEIIPFNIYGEVSQHFFMWVLKSSYVDSVVNGASYGVKMPRVGTDTMRNLLIPLPPLSEQHRIIAKIEELMPLVDQYDKAYSQLTVLNEEFPQDMKKSILQYAIEGKLVEQRPEEGTAKELLKEIKLEKEKLVKEGKIKKSKSLPPITEDEIPFDIPENWEWVRLGEIASKIGAGSTPSGGKAVYLDAGIKFIRSQNVYNDGLRMAGMAFISEEINNKKQGSIVQSKDILLNITGGSIGRCALVPDDFDIANINQHILIIRNINEMCRYYLHKVLISPYIQELIMSVQVGVSREGLSAEKTKNMLIPLPPLSEQHRIVAKIEELMPLCDKLSKTT